MKKRSTKKMIVANWKMAPTSFTEAHKIVTGVTKFAGANPKSEVVFCPPFIWLDKISASLKKSKNYSLGAQDVFWENPSKGGAFTGEISCEMLIKSGAEYVIIGHSERRKWLGETNEMVNKKVISALSAGLKVILCVGEWERTDDNYTDFIRQQVLSAMNGVGVKDLNNLVIAYEPVWAIGTGKPDTPDSAMSVAILIKKIINDKFQKKNTPRIKVLYGGSVNKDNAEKFLKQNFIDGALIGGESLSPENFARIINL